MSIFMINFFVFIPLSTWWRGVRGEVFESEQEISKEL